MSTIKTIVKTKFLCKSGCKTAEKGEKEEINRIKMSTIFQLDIDELRDNKIKEILKKDNE